MKGIVFNLLSRVVSDAHGEDTWDAILDAAGVEGAYTSLGTYPDEELTGLIAEASKILGEPAGAIVRWFGRGALPLLAETYPQFFTAHRSTRSFLMTLNDIIHPEVRKVYPGAEVPDFDYDTGSNETLVMSYRSKRRLCAFGEGLIEGAAAHFGEKVSIEQPQCMLRGDERCTFSITFSTKDG